ncbi:MAG: hydroxymethylbilane synthase [Candidatus Omnitrophota bacterium]|nr:hydroxymethylbilane synthase [Candidatus Omnitrophota bacterium]
MSLVFERTLRIGTRSSPLALKQVEEALGYLKRFYPQIRVEIIGIDTYGDKDKITPISESEGTDFFTREIDEALLRGDIDFAVHSAKDLPDEVPKGLAIAAITKSIDPYDALVSKSNLKIGELRKGAKIGASSLRRKTQLKKYRDDFQIVDVRGTIEERLDKLDNHGLDAIIVAACALIRLELEHRITQRIPFEILKPHSLQGSLAIEARAEDLDLIKFLSKIDSREILSV